MRARTLILFVIAIMLAGGTAMLVRSWLMQQRTAEVKEAPPERPVAPPQSILVARGEISRGQILKPADLTWQPWHDGGINQAYIREGTKAIDAFVGWVARGSFGPGEPVTEAKIVAPGSRGFLAAALRPGMRAVSVPVNPTSDISGFVLPGDQVDIDYTSAADDQREGRFGPAPGGRDRATRRAGPRGRPEDRKQGRRSGRRENRDAGSDPQTERDNRRRD